MVGVWLVAVIVLGSLGGGLGDRLSNGGYEVSGSESQRALDIRESAFPEQRGTTVHVLFAAGAEPALRRAARTAQRRLRRLDFVGAVAPPKVARDRTAVILPVQLRLDFAEAQKRIGEVRDAAAADDPRVTSDVLGLVSAIDRYSEIGKEDLTKAEQVSLPITLVVLLIAFLSVVAACVPFVLALATLGMTFGALYLLSFALDLSVFVTNSALLLGLGLSIDFSLFMVMRFRELVAQGASTSDAIVETVGTTGRAVAFSGLTVAAALGSLLAVGLGIFDSMALGASLAALLAAAAALTLVPAVLQLLGPRIDRFQLRRAAAAAQGGRFWRSLSRRVLRRRVLVVFGCLAVLAPLTIPAFGIQTDMRSLSLLPEDEPLRRAEALAADRFGAGNAAPVEIYARSDVGRVAAVVRRDPGIRAVTARVRGREGWTQIQAALRGPPDTPRSEATAERLRRSLDQAGLGHAVVGGVSAEIADFTRRLADRTPVVIAVAVLLHMTILLVAFQSLLVPLKAVATTLLSVGATLGVLRLLFEDLNGTPLPYFLPLFLFAIVFGLSTDYEVFLLSRMREAFLRGASTAEYVEEGLVRSARSITLAGVVLITVFLGFTTSSLLPFQQMGIGLALAILIDITLVRGLLVPALVGLLGDRNWWLPVRGLPPRGDEFRAAAPLRAPTRVVSATEAD